MGFTVMHVTVYKSLFPSLQRGTGGKTFYLYKVIRRERGLLFMSSQISSRLRLVFGLCLFAGWNYEGTSSLNPQPRAPSTSAFITGYDGELSGAKETLQDGCQWRELCILELLPNANLPPASIQKSESAFKKLEFNFRFKPRSKQNDFGRFEIRQTPL